MTDSLKVIAENTTHFMGVEGMFDYGTTMTERWYDQYADLGADEIHEDTRSCLEVVDDIWSNMTRGR